MSKTLVPKSYKAKVDRALHNLYQEKTTSLHPMLAIPIYYRRLFRGQSVDFCVLESILRSEPTFAPLLSNWRLEFQWYFDSDANRYGWIDNNTRLSSEEVMNRKHHTYVTRNWSQAGELAHNPNTGEYPTKRGSISDYSGIAPGYICIINSDDSNDVAKEYHSTFNLDFYLTYLNIIRNYHVNKQFPTIPYINSSVYSYYGQGYYLQDMDDLFVFLRSCKNGVQFNLATMTTDAPTELATYYFDAVRSFMSWLNSTSSTCGGLFCTQFEPDLYQNLLARDRGLLQSVVTIQDVAGQSGITIEQFRLKNHLQGLYDKIFVSGGTDRDLSRTIWGIESNRDYDIPELLSVHSEIIGTNLIQASQASSAEYNGNNVKTAPGSMAGNINVRRGKSGIQKFTAKTAGSLMCIVTLTPMVGYCENIERHLLEHNFMDEFTPDMARKGFEDVPLSDYCALPKYRVSSSEKEWAYQDFSKSVGKQVAWLREMTAVNRFHGEFAKGGFNEDWVLRRTFERYNGTEDDGQNTYDITPYGHPLDYQYPFVAQDIDTPNFNLQAAFYVKTYSPVPRRFMPNLGN